MWCQAHVSVSATDWDIEMGSWVGKYWYLNRGCVAVAVPSITSRGPSRATLYLIFHFLLKKPKKILVMDPSMTNVEKSVFNLNADWKELYRGVVESGPSSDARDFSKSSVFWMLCLCIPWWQCHHKALTLWNSFFVNNTLKNSFSKGQKKSSQVRLAQR